MLGPPSSDRWDRFSKPAPFRESAVGREAARADERSWNGEREQLRHILARRVVLPAPLEGEGYEPNLATIRQWRDG